MLSIGGEGAWSEENAKENLRLPGFLPREHTELSSANSSNYLDLEHSLFGV